MNRELTLLDNPIVTEHTGAARNPTDNPIVTKSTGAARTPTEHRNTGAAKNPTAGVARQPTKHTTGEARNPTKDIISAARNTMNISMIGAAPFNHLVQKSQKDSRFQIFSVTLRDINIALAPKKHTDPATKLPSEYHDFLDVFSRSDADVLPKHRPRYDHSIELIEGKTPT